MPAAVGRSQRLGGTSEATITPRRVPPEGPAEATLLPKQLLPAISNPGPGKDFDRSSPRRPKEPPPMRSFYALTSSGSGFKYDSSSHTRARLGFHRSPRQQQHQIRLRPLPPDSVSPRLGYSAEKILHGAFLKHRRLYVAPPVPPPAPPLEAPPSRVATANWESRPCTVWAPEDAHRPGSVSWPRVQEDAALRYIGEEVAAEVVDSSWTCIQEVEECDANDGLLS